MSYATNKVYPIPADVNALATQLAQRQSDSGTTNGGIVASGSPALPQLGVDGIGMGLAYLQAMADAIMCAVGFQAEFSNALSTNSTSSTSYVDVPGTGVTFFAPLARTYTVHCDFAYFFSAGTNPFVNVRLVVNGAAGPDLIGQEPGAATFAHKNLHLMHAATCAAGNNTIKLQWRVQAGTTVSVNTTDYANYIVSG